MDITLYSFEDEIGCESDFTTRDFQEAQKYARQAGYLLIENTFEWADSAPVEDHRGGHFSQHFAVMGVVLSPEHDNIDAACTECEWAPEEKE